MHRVRSTHVFVFEFRPCPPLLATRVANGGQFLVQYILQLLEGNGLVNLRIQLLGEVSEWVERPRALQLG